MADHFIAFPASDRVLVEQVESAAASASQNGNNYLPWTKKDTSGFPVAQSVEQWVRTADGIVADISTPNLNVTYEIGLAIGLGKPLRLIRNAQTPFTPVREIGLLDTLGHDEWTTATELSRLLTNFPPTRSTWPEVRKNLSQPIYFLISEPDSDSSVRIGSALKKLAKIRYRIFNSAEVPRLSAAEAHSHAASSFGLVCTWHSADATSKNNHRSMFLCGLARGLGVPWLLLAEPNATLPLDLNDLAKRYAKLDDIDRFVREFREDVLLAEEQHTDAKSRPTGRLEQYSLGDPTAENEADQLSDYFVETEGYRRTFEKRSNTVLGRKGVGKTALFMQMRDRVRGNKNNIVVDLKPEGHQLLKLKEYVVDQLNLGSRQEFLAAFWEYIIWLEITYKLLEKDGLRARYDHILQERYSKIEADYRSRVDTGVADFSERLVALTDTIIDRFQTKNASAAEVLKSKSVLEIVYGEDISHLRSQVFDYLAEKSSTLVMFDNLDRIWRPGGFDESDAHLLIGLIESLQEIRRKFSKAKRDFGWVVFIRHDVFEFVVKATADYGKFDAISLDWTDRGLLAEIIKNRVLANDASKGKSWDTVWKQLSVENVDNKSAMDFLIDASMYRPRYLIRLLEVAKGRASTFERERIEVEDYHAALRELGWQVLQDLNRELSDIVYQAQDVLLEVVQSANGVPAELFTQSLATRLKSQNIAGQVFDVLLFSGSIGIASGDATYFIYDCGYNLGFLKAKITARPGARIALHPTLLSLI